MGKISVEEQAFYVDVLSTYPLALDQTADRVEEDLEVVQVLRRNGEEERAREVLDQTNQFNSLVEGALQQRNSNQS